MTSCLLSCTTSPFWKSLKIKKTRLFKYTENFTTKKWKFSDKNSDIFHYAWQGGSNMYSQSMFFSRNKKSNAYPCKPQFYYIKVGLRGSKLYRHVFVMGKNLPNLIDQTEKKNHYGLQELPYFYQTVLIKYKFAIHQKGSTFKQLFVLVWLGVNSPVDIIEVMPNESVFWTTLSFLGRLIPQVVNQFLCTFCLQKLTTAL